jgi:hypothetical protein
MRLPKPSYWPLLLCCALSCSGKKDKPSVGDEEDPSVTRTEVLSACGDFARSFCANMASCCEGVHGAHDPEACEQVIDQTVCRPGADAVIAGRADFDAGAVTPCLAAYERAFETCQADWAEVLDLRAAILRACRVIDGRTQPGGGCQTPVTFKKPEGAATAVCARGSCQAGEILPQASECPFPSGEVSVCAPGLYCSAPGLEESGLCEPSLAPGADCDPNGGANACGLGNYCERVSETCQPADNFGGSSCSQDGECVSFSCNEVVDECLTSAVVTLATCTGQ